MNPPNKPINDANTSQVRQEVEPETETRKPRATEIEDETPVVSKEINKEINRIEIMNEIENKTAAKVMGFKQKSFESNSQAQNTLIGIMQQGADEFKEKMGRNMTYSEMRQMYG